MASRSGQSEYEESIQPSDTSDRTVSSKKPHKYGTISSSEKASRQPSGRYERGDDGEREREREEEERRRRKEKEREEKEKEKERNRRREGNEDSRRRDESIDRYTSSIAGKSTDSLDTLDPSDSISSVGPRAPLSSVASDSTLTPLPTRSRVSTMSKSTDRKSDSGKGKKREVESNYSTRKQDSGNSVAPSIISSVSSRAPPSSTASHSTRTPSSIGSEISTISNDTVLANRRAKSDARSDYSASTRVSSKYGSDVSGATEKQRYMIPVQLPQSGTSKDSDPSESTSHGAPVRLTPRNISYTKPLVVRPHPQFKNA
ncbi:uncharacterized protein Bfra_005788 [Botrytis fragariae]|uniref:Uncharacterized protein n=1 Tax=Botrytis fragariae TaxID=1964551 RepID=A0A8H6EHE6_9HELO|nr:uncharacterized protein Bfra_005788 [Botrytis fragariae]KAF5872429.1 hypothetical protein Bfra_005788 [Botrytis fragariae]